MAASRIAALIHPMTSTSQVIFSPSILDSGAAHCLKTSDLLVAGPDSIHEQIGGSRNQPSVPVPSGVSSSSRLLNPIQVLRTK
jgi:hypothetical protein